MQSECIFVGNVIEVNEDLTYKIVVIESLDGGDVQGNVYLGQNWRYCYPYVDKKGTWLVYGSIENGFFKVNSCGLSRSFDKPSAPISDSKEILELERELESKNLGESKSYEIFKKMQLLDLANELKALRKRRDYRLRRDEV